MASIGPLQVSYYLIGSDSADATLTAAYSGNTSGVFLVGREMGQLILYVSYTPKAGQSDRYVLVRVELGPDSSSLYRTIKVEDATNDYEVIWKGYDGIVPAESGSTGGVEYARRIAIPVADKYGRVSVKESGSSDFGTCTIRATITSRSS